MEIQRRGFIQLAGASLFAMLSKAAWAASRFEALDIRVPIAGDNPALSFDADRCIECSECQVACRESAGVWGYYSLEKTGDEPVCIHCGQCAAVCQGDAILPRSELEAVKAAVADKSRVVVVSTSPAVRVALAEPFGAPAGTNCEGQMVAALRKLGVDFVLDTTFAADLTIMEEAGELVERITKKGVLPMFTSCCPAWVKFVETFYPELIPHLSTAKSPIGMQGPSVRTFFAKAKGIDPKRIFNVALTPCTAKKFEIRRDELAGMDAVITTRELAEWLKSAKVDPLKLEASKYDDLMGRGSGAGVIFGNTGGVMEAALRTAYWMVEKKAPPAALLDYKPVRDLANSAKTASLEVGGSSVTVTVVQSTAQARKFIESGAWKQSTFIEVMACRGGCIGGGGQPRTSVPLSDKHRKARIAGLYSADAKDKVRNSHENPQVLRLHQEFSKERRHELFHTTYRKRDFKG